jgi:energy-converting hydrogenase Eha subunit C
MDRQKGEDGMTHDHRQGDRAGSFGMPAGRPLADVLRLLAFSAVLLGALAYLGWKAFSPSVAGIDFKYLWFAGELWAEGTSPYGPHYQERAREIFVGTNVPWMMAYPPNWYPLSQAVALLPLETAERLWGVLSAVMLLGSGALVARTVWPLRAHDAVWPFVAFGTFLCMGSATAIALSLGQTAPLMAVGLALFLHGFVTRSRLALGAALIILMLKPNFGLPFVAFLLVWPGLWPAVLGAGAVSIAAAAMALLPYGPVTVLVAYVEGLGSYGDSAVNSPPSLTGLVNMVHHAIGWNLGGFLPVGLAIMAALPLAILLRTMEAQGTTSGPVRLSVALALLSATLFLVPLHTYDLLLAAPLLLLPALARAQWELVTLGSLACFLVVFRMNNLARASGLNLPGETNFAGSAVASVALLVLVLVSLLHVRNEARQTGPPAT